MLSIEGGKAPQRLVGGKHQIYIEEWVRERERGGEGERERGGRQEMRREGESVGEREGMGKGERGVSE